MGHFFTAFLVATLVPLLIRWLMRSALLESAEIEQSSGDLVMTPSRAIRRVVFGSVAVILALDAVFIYVTLPFPKLALGLGAMLVAPLSFLVVAPALYDLRRRVYVSREGLQSFSPWTGRKSATWNEVEAVSFRQWGQTIRIRLKSGGLIAIPCSTKNGLQQLESRMREQLQPVVFEQAFDSYRTYSRLHQRQQ
jgi:hypothetical protein